MELLKETIARYGPPDIMNNDQDSQYKLAGFEQKRYKPMISVLAWLGKDAVTTISTWNGRSLKQEEVYLQDYRSLSDTRNAIARYIQQYNQSRPHQSLQEKTPERIYNGQATWMPGQPQTRPQERKKEKNGSIKTPKILKPGQNQNCLDISVHHTQL